MAGLLSKFKRPVPFYEGTIEQGKKAFGNWGIFFAALFSFVVTIIMGVIVQLILHAAAGLPVVCAYIGIWIGVYWFCRRFYKKNHRLMTREEFHQIKRKLVFANVSIEVLFILLYCGLLSLLHVACEQQSVNGCDWVNSVFNQLPSFGVLFIIGVVVVLLAILIVWLFVSTSLKFSMRSVHKQFIEPKVKNG